MKKRSSHAFGLARGGIYIYSAGDLFSVSKTRPSLTYVAEQT